MAEIKTLPMVPPTHTRIDHLSLLFFLLDFLITNKHLSVLITTKQAICAENGQFNIYCYDKYYIWKRWDKNFERPQNLHAFQNYKLTFRNTKMPLPLERLKAQSGAKMAVLLRMSILGLTRPSD